MLLAHHPLARAHVRASQVPTRRRGALPVVSGAIPFHQSEGRGALDPGVVQDRHKDRKAIHLRIEPDRREVRKERRPDDSTAILQALRGRNRRS